MSLPQSAVKRLLKDAGITATAEQIAATTRLYNLIDKQLGDVPAESLRDVEPDYIQPHRPERRPV